MESGNSLVSDESSLRHKKYLSLEARHSIAIETARKIRLSLPSSIFIPKQKPLKSPTSSTRISSNTTPNKRIQLSPKTKDDQNLYSNSIATKSRKLKQYHKFLLKRKHIIKSTLWSPPTNSHQTREVPAVLFDQSVEDKLKHMGLEICNKAGELVAAKSMETAFKNVDKIVDNNYTNKENSKHLEIPNRAKTKKLGKPLETSSLKAHKSRQAKSSKNAISESHIKKTDCKQKPINITSLSHAQTLSKPTNPIVSLPSQQYQNYNDSLYAMKEFQDLVFSTIEVDAASSADQEIYQIFMQLQKSITEFSMFLFESYENINLLKLISSRSTNSTNAPINVNQSAPDLVVPIEDPNMSEQIVISNTTDTLQYSVGNHQKNEAIYQKKNYTKHAKESKTNNSGTQIELLAPTEYRTQSPLTCHVISATEPSIIPAIHPAYRYQNHIVVNQTVPHTKALMPQEVHPHFSNPSNSLTPATANLRGCASEMKLEHSNNMHRDMDNLRQSRPPNFHYSKQTDIFLRDAISHQPRISHLNDAMICQNPPSDSRECIPLPYPAVCHPLLTPPQSTDLQVSPIYRPIPYYPPPYYSQAIPITPPSEDLIYETTHLLQDPAILPIYLGDILSAPLTYPRLHGSS